MKKKICVMLSIFIIIGSLVPSFAVFANENVEEYNVVLEDNGKVAFNQEQIEILNEIKNNDGPKARVGGKKAAITIAKWILKNRQKLTNTVGAVIGRDAAVKFGAALKFMEGPLRRITNANNQGMKAIYNIIYDGLRASGMHQNTAKNIASGIRGILEWII